MPTVVLSGELFLADCLLLHFFSILLLILAHGPNPQLFFVFDMYLRLLTP